MASAHKTAEPAATFLPPTPTVMLISALAVLATAVGLAALVPAQASNSTKATYTNPILEGYGADPWVIRDGDYYYMTFTTPTTSNITMLRSLSLTNWNNADVKILWTPPPSMPYSTDLWAPEIHLIDGRYYADPAYDSPPPQETMYCTFDCPALNHRMYVLQSSGADIWASTYELRGQLNTFDQFAIDGTYFQYDGALYHVYSCWFSQYESWPANLCITKMSNPWTVSSNLTERTIISVPTNPWEQTPYGRTFNVRLASNEGPEQLVSPTGDQFIIFSAARSDNPNYCLAQLALKPAGDPMNAEDWVKYDGCVFYQDKRTMASGVGHASFVKSPDGNEDWIVYHGFYNAWEGGGARTIRTQRFTWNADGSPQFPRPGYGPYEVPSGQ